MHSFESDTYSWPWRAAVLLGAYCLIGGIVSFCGWVFDVPDLTDWSGTGISIQPNASLTVSAAGAAVLLLNFGLHRFSLALGLIVLLVGAVTLFQIATDINLGLDTPLMFGREWGRGGVLSPGRMGTPGATSWTLIGVSLVLANVFLTNQARVRFGNTRPAAAALAMMTLAISMLSLVGYAFGAQILYTLPRYTVIAMQTATFIFAISIALILSVREAGPMRLILDQGPAGTLARRILPAVVLVPLTLGFFRLLGEQAGLYDLAFGTAIRTVVEIFLLIALLWWASIAVRRQAGEAAAADLKARDVDLRFLKFMERLPGLAWIKDADGKYVFTNDAAAAAFGLPAEQLYGKTDQEIFPLDVAKSFTDNDRLALSNGKELKTVEELIDESGSIRYSLVNKFPIAAEDGQRLIGGIAIDITDQQAIQKNQEFLFSIAEKIRVGSSPESLMADIAASVGEFLGLHRCLFNEIDLGNDVEIVQGDYSRDGDSVAGEHKISDYSAEASASMSGGKTVVNRDSKTDPRTAHLFDRTYGPAGEHAYIAVPMIRDGRWVASLWCSDDRPRNWTETEVGLVEQIAERTWSAILKTRAETALRESEARLTAELAATRELQKISGQLILEDDIDALYKHVLDAACALMRSEIGSLQMFVPERGELKLLAWRGFAPESAKFWEWVRPDSASTCGVALKTGERVIAADVETCAFMADTEDLEFYRRSGIRAVQTTPLTSRDGKIVGMISNHWLETHEPAERDLHLLDLLARQAADIIERRRSEELVRESEEKFRTLFDSIDEGFVIVEMIFDENDKPVDYRFVQANPAFARLTGLPEDAIGKTARELVPDLEEFWFETYGKVALTGEPARFENKSEPMGRWFNVRASKVGGEGSRRVAIVFENATDRKISENALRESEQRFRNMADHAPVMVWVTDATGYCTFLSESWYEFTGQSPETGLGFGWLEATHPDDKAAAEAVFTAANGKCEPFSIEYRLRRKESDYRWAIDSARPRFSEDGVFLGYIGSVIDIHERREAEEERRRDQQRFDIVRDGAEVGFWFCDLPFDELIWDNRVKEHFWLPPDARVTIETFYERLHPDDRERTRESIAASIANKTYYNIEYRTVGPEQEIKWIRAVGRTFYDPNGDPIRFDGVTLDITDRKRDEESLSESEERFSKAFNASPLVLTISSLETGKLLEVNDTFVDVTGFTRDAAVGKTTLELGLWSRPVDREAEMAHVAENGQLRNAEYVFTVRGGREIVGLLSAERIVIGGETCALTVIHDITDRKRSEAALRESEARFRYASDSAPAQIWMSDHTMGFVWFNQPWLEFTGRSMDEELGFGWADGVHPEDRDRCANVYKTAFDARRKFTMEYRLRRADGEYRWLLEHGVPRFDSDGMFLGYIGSSTDIHDRREAESALRRSEARLQLAMRIGNFGTFDLNYVENKMVWSEKLFEIFGVPVTPDRSMTLEQFDGLMHADEADKLAREFSLAKEHRQVFSGEYRILKRGRAEPNWIQAVAQFFYDPSGNPVRCVGIAQDITESKSIEARIRASEEQLRLITNSIPALVSFIDREGRYRFVNAQYEAWFGGSGEDLVGKSMTEMLGADAFEVIKPRVDAALAGKQVTFDAWLNYRRVGLRYVHVSYVPHINQNGLVAGFYALVTDLTEQKRSEDLLRSSERRMQMLTESFTDYAIISTDTDGYIESWNPGAMNIFGYTEEDILGCSSDILFTPEDVAKGVPVQEMRNARKSGRAIDERWHIKKDGTRFFANGVMAPLYVGETLTGYAKIATDLTERKRNAEALQRAYDEMEMRVLDRTRELAAANESLLNEINERQSAERQKIGLLQRIVGTQEDERRRIARDLHDHLGQRLTALRLKLASLRDACAGDEDLYARATRLQQIAELIDSEVSFLAWELRPSALDELGLEEAIETFVKEWSRHYEKRGEFHSTGLGDLRLDPEMETQLYRITQEALNNVVKHADAEGASVLIEKAGDNIVLIIEDDGKGFDADAILSASKSGRGLGLFGMRERAELIGGTMDIESEPGRGTTVYVRILLARLGLKR